MSKTKRLSYGIRKYIRTQKARIRREVLDIEEQQRLIRELYMRFGSSEKEKS